MEKYNKVFLALWLLLSAALLALLTSFGLTGLAPIFDVEESLEGEGLAVSFLLFFFISLVIGFALARSVIDRKPWTHPVHVFISNEP